MDFRICSFCLSMNRRTSPVLELSENLLNMRAFNIYSQSTQLCWECNAHLKNYSQFCERAERAQEMLDQVHTQESLESKSLSSLVKTNTLVISIDSKIVDINDNSSPADYIQMGQDAETVNYELEIPKEKSDVSVDFDAWTFEDDYLEPKSLNNCGEPRLAIELPFNKGDELVDKRTENTEGNADPKCIKRNVTDSHNGPKKKNIHSSVKKSSDVKFSQNLEIVHGQYMKFTATEGEMREYLKPIFFKNKCKICLSEFKTIENLVKHFKQFHFDCVGEHKCDVCSFGQPTETALELHRQQHFVLYRCLAAGCRFVHKFPSALRKHGTTQKRKRENEETCECQHCKKKFTNRCNLIIHIRRIHINGTKCKHCSKDLPDRKSLRQHMLLLHGDKMLICDICGSKYATSKKLRHHLINHRNLSLKRYTCTICNKSFCNRFKERLHQIVHNGKARIICHLCKTEFIEEEARIRHLEYRHGVSREDALLRKENFTLLSFKKSCPSSNAKRSLRRGITREQPTKCKICGRECKFPSFLKYHMARHFDDERPFKCDICKKSFKYKANLYTHMAVHSGEKPYMCHICRASFKYKCNLKNHMMTHTGIKPFDCKVCGKKFSYNSNLKKHSKIH